MLLEAALKQKNETIEDLQQRNLEIAKGLINQTDI